MPFSSGVNSRKIVCDTGCLKKNFKDVSRRVDKAYKKIHSGQRVFDKHIDEIDIHIERMLLSGKDPDEIKMMSLKSIKSEMFSLLNFEFKQFFCHHFLRIIKE